MNDNLPQVLDGQSTHLAIQRDPSAVLAEATKAAIALKEVISKKAKPVMFNGEQYLEFEDWQTLGKFYSLSAQTRDALPVDINGVQGAKASADVVDLRSGEIIGHAESYCMRDEQNWKSKPWFQLASMAQTRAGSKALRNVLSWVVVLAGYKPTPAEEMESIQPDASQSTSPNKGNIISEPQRKRLYAIWKSGGKSDQEVHDFIQDHYGLDSTKAITTDIYEEICTWAAGKK